MKKQHSNEMQSIRKKLLAAIAMLLVAVIMTVSSTYAWFTLSTAPEVKGITTTVGANGNLEIALGKYDTVYQGVTPGANEGDSMAAQDVKAANVTWGNLVDLSTGYGLDAVKLYPTRLNATSKEALNAGSPLQFALYGTDGRVSELSGNTKLGTVNNAGNGFETFDTINFAGVNAIGSVSEMSARQFAASNYKNAIDSYRNSAQAEAKGAISLYAGDLAGLALDYKDATGTESVDAEKIESLTKLIVKLRAANDNIGKSLKSAALLSITCYQDLTDAGWDTVIDTAKDDSYTIQQLIANLDTIAGEAGALADLPSEITDLVADHEAIYTLLDDAEEALEKAAEDSTYLWSEISSAVGALLNKDGILICDFTIDEILADKAAGGVDGGAMEQLGDAVFAGGVNFSFASGSGVFSNIAELAGDYNTNITFPENFKVEGIKLGGKPFPVNVYNTTDATDKGSLGVMFELLKGSTPPSVTDPTVAKALTDTFGYTVDMLFRTNATESSLQLQTEAANRIYAGNDNAELMGGGSNMSFTVGGEYDPAKINGLANGIRVVFYDSSLANTKILAVATLDTANAKSSGDQYVLPLKLQNFDIAANGQITNLTDKEDASICALTANLPKRVTALVYLDGDVIDNSNVGVVENLDGKLNLQFSSSASLKPMDNNALKNTVTEAQ